MTAFLIIDLNINDIGGFMEYVRRIPELIEKYSGRYLVQGVEPKVIEGKDSPGRSVVLEFPSKDHAEEFLGERASSDLTDIWVRTTEARILLVEGVD